MLSLFAGMGGLDLGAHMAGLRVVLALDSDRSALDVISAGLAVPTLRAESQTARPRPVIAAAGLRTDGSAILIGGPPCTAFSHAGFWLEHKRNGEDAQADRIADYCRFLSALKPRAFVMENVPGLLFETHRGVFNSFVKRVRKLGYHTSWQVLNAADFGVPQARRRLIVVGMKAQQAYQFPVGGFSGAPRTAGWAFKNLPSNGKEAEPDEELGGKYSTLLKRIPEGGNYLVFTKERGYRAPKFKWRSRYWSFLLKLDRKMPSPTIAATRISNNGPFHWHNRRLRLHELARLQGIPDELPLHASLERARRHLGNAVPPLLAAQLFWSLRAQLGEVKQADLPDCIGAALEMEASAAQVSKAIARALPKASIPRIEIDVR